MKKKNIICIIMILVSLSLLCGCSSDEKGDKKDEVINISEKVYVTYINDIYTNPQEYLGKTIKIQGMFKSETIGDTVYDYVYRIGPGCCGSDGDMCGFEYTYDGEIPSNNDWIEVEGKLIEYEEEGEKFICIQANSVKVKNDDRGKENVNQ